jgi:hypothetical protein
VELDIAAELFGELAGLLQPCGIGDRGGDAPLLLGTVREGQRAEETQPLAKIQSPQGF